MNTIENKENTKSYKTRELCPKCFEKYPNTNLICIFESIFAGTNKTRHLECPICGYKTQDVINEKGFVIITK